MKRTVFCEEIGKLSSFDNEQIRNTIKKFNPTNNTAEIESWEHSIPILVNILHRAGLDNVALAAETELPTGGRIDATILGYSVSDHKPTALIVELKQWSRTGIAFYPGYSMIKIKGRNGDYPSIHPIGQTASYEQYLRRNHAGVLDHKLSICTCQFLFNYDVKDKSELFSRDFAQYKNRESEMFCKGEEQRFISFLKKIFTHDISDNTLVKDLFFDSGYRINDHDVDVFSDIISRPDNITLIEDQVPFNECISALLSQLVDKTLSRRHMFLISGAAGTGKTIVGFKTLSEYCRIVRKQPGNAIYSCAYALPRSRTIQAVLNGVGSGLQAVFLNNLHGKFDLLVVDEAHRVTDFSLAQGGTGTALNSAKILLVLQDDDQRVLGNETGTIDNYQKFAQENSFTFHHYPLTIQKRAGFGGYVDRIDSLLYGKQLPPALKENSLDVRVYDSLTELEYAIKTIHNNNPRVKYYAPYCWKWKSKTDKTSMDIVIPADAPEFAKQWNPYPATAQYSWYKDSVNQVGCVYTAQGLGFDYVGLIWWDDLKWNAKQKRWDIDFEKVTRYDSLLAPTIKGARNYDYIMLNIYRVLLTRAKKGIFIWFKDQATKQHFCDVVLNS